LMATLTTASPVMAMVAYYCIINFGTALFQAPNNSLIMSSVPPAKLGIGGSTSMALRNVGWTAGMAFTTAILYGGMSKVMGYRVTGYVQGQGMDDAFMYGMRNAYLVSAFVCIFSIASSIWGARLRKSAGQAPRHA